MVVEAIGFVKTVGGINWLVRETLGWVRRIAVELWSGSCMGWRKGKWKVALLKYSTKNTYPVTPDYPQIGPITKASGAII